MQPIIAYDILGYKSLYVPIGYAPLEENWSAFGEIEEKHHSGFLLIHGGKWHSFFAPPVRAYAQGVSK